MTVALRRFIAEDGERHAILVDEQGMPLFYPTLWVTVVIRGGARALNTIQNALNALKCLYVWEERFGINIEQRFARGLILQGREIHALRDFLQESLSHDAEPRAAVPVSRRCKTVSSSSHYARMTVAAEYLEFLARRLCPVSEENERRITSMVTQIKANRPKQTSKTLGNDREERFLNDAELDLLAERLKPGAENNPFAGYPVQFRNALMFAILRVTGLRRGELLNLRVDDIDFAANTLRVVRRADSPQDIRRYQPVAKTRERQFPLDPELLSTIHDYVVLHRSKLPAAKRHGYLFVTHKEGRYLGSPLSNSGFSKFIAGLITTSGRLHAHKLRHHWNYTFSSLSDAKGLTAAREEKLRSYLMGWV